MIALTGRNFCSAGIEALCLLLRSADCSAGIEALCLLLRSADRVYVTHHCK